MEIIDGQQGPLVHEHVYNKGHQRIGHRILPKGLANDKITLHPAPAHGVVIPVKGRIEFGTADGPKELYPGRIAVMEKGDPHYMKAIEDSEVFVVLDLEK
ncbi:hypothetical protein ACNAN0_11735 [Agrilactobacillus fermenti]|uniref:hypothetical protein n=1 Tax=Agrilactobacillus fermenti TaxID=2586909 RepID=UPI001E50C421|nr:hypothetical protein [Agrilactobacillus fermenti]MCD2255720.1 hypothetical protein [Agrilactobacillus fermenti]